MPYSVYTLQVITKNDLEDAGHLTGDLKRLVRKWCHPGMHAKRNIGLVIATEETLEELHMRIAPALHDMIELGRVERFFLQLAPDQVTSDYGSFDPLMHWIGLGRAEARKRNQPKDMRHRKRGKRRI